MGAGTLAVGRARSLWSWTPSVARLVGRSFSHYDGGSPAGRTGRIGWDASYFPFVSILNCDKGKAMGAENRRILIIDDERPILLTLEALLGRHGYQPETASTAAYGLRVLQKNPPAVVLLDLQLPDAEGLQTLDQIKREHPETQVIIL